MNCKILKLCPTVTIEHAKKRDFHVPYRSITYPKMSVKKLHSTAETVYTEFSFESCEVHDCAALEHVPSDVPFISRLISWVVAVEFTGHSSRKYPKILRLLTKKQLAKQWEILRLKNVDYYCASLNFELQYFYICLKKDY